MRYAACWTSAFGFSVPKYHVDCDLSMICPRCPLLLCGADNVALTFERYGGIVEVFFSDLFL